LQDKPMKEYQIDDVLPHSLANALRKEIFRRTYKKEDAGIGKHICSNRQIFICDMSRPGYP